MKAILLAAGRGNRMRPLTDDMPKPLLKVGQYSLIERHIKACYQVGIQDIVINVSYRAKQIMDYLGDGKQYGVNITYSYEENALGVGGGICQALPFLGEKPFLVMSSDLWTQYPLVNLQQKLKGDAHLVLVDNPSFYPQGDYCLQENGYLNEGTPALTYAGIALLHPNLFRHAKQGQDVLSHLFKKAINAQRVTGEHYQGIWYNVGTPEQLQAIVKGRGC